MLRSLFRWVGPKLKRQAMSKWYYWPNFRNDCKVRIHDRGKIVRILDNYNSQILRFGWKFVIRDQNELGRVVVNQNVTFVFTLDKPMGGSVKRGKSSQLGVSPSLIKIDSLQTSLGEIILKVDLRLVNMEPLRGTSHVIFCLRTNLLHT